MSSVIDQHFPDTTITNVEEPKKDDFREPEELTGSEIIIRCLAQEDVDTVFGYPGGVVLSLYDKLFDLNNLRHILIRHEQGGTHAADGYARATGKTGVVMVTSGPGATNTVTGIANAFMDSIPLVIFTGQVPSSMIGNEAFQEADIVGITRPITKHSFLVKDVSQLADVIHKAFFIASTGRPGPVLVDIPKDTLLAKATYSPRTTPVNLRGYKPTGRGSYPQIKKAVELIHSAKKPVIYAGGGIISADAAGELTELANILNAPVTTTLLGLGAFPETSNLSLGMLGMHGTWYANMAITECDVLVAVGARFDDRVTGRIKDFAPNAKIVHVDIDPSCISRNVPVDVPIVGDVKQVLSDMVHLVHRLNTEIWINTIAQWKKEHPLSYQDSPDILKPQKVIQIVSELTQGDAIVVTDVGQHQMWAAQWYQFTQPRSFISSGGLGTMGFGFPAAVGAAIGKPDRTVVSFSGDGGFQMTAMELATAVKYQVPVKIVVLNNGFLGMVRQWQQLFFDKRYAHTNLGSSNPDFAKLAESYGAKAYAATNASEFESAFKHMLEEKNLPTLVNAFVTREENVYPMVPAGAALYEMIEGEEK